MSIKLSGLKSFNVTPIIEQIIKVRGWNRLYAERVAEEYIKFIIIRSSSPLSSPSTDIDIFWHQHLLNTEHYFNFCQNNFDKFVHHNPEDANDRTAQGKRLQNTISIYKNTFSYIDNHVWFYTNIENLEGQTGPTGPTGATGATGPC